MVLFYYTTYLIKTVSKVCKDFLRAKKVEKRSKIKKKNVALLVTNHFWHGNLNDRF